MAGTRRAVKDSGLAKGDVLLTASVAAAQAAPIQTLSQLNTLLKKVKALKFGNKKKLRVRMTFRAGLHACDALRELAVRMALLMALLQCTPSPHPARSVSPRSALHRQGRAAHQGEQRGQ